MSAATTASTTTPSTDTSSHAKSTAGESGTGLAFADAIYAYDEEAINKIRRERPWENKSVETPETKAKRQDEIAKSINRYVFHYNGMPFSRLPISGSSVASLTSSIHFFHFHACLSSFSVKHFQTCRISALAAMKMLKHALAGVEKGRKAGTNPIEVMGLMIGKIGQTHTHAHANNEHQMQQTRGNKWQVEAYSMGISRWSLILYSLCNVASFLDGDAIVVLDCCALPVEGSETRVVADDAQVYMTQLMDSMELRRKEGFIGWYHR